MGISLVYGRFTHLISIHFLEDFDNHCGFAIGAYAQVLNGQGMAATPALWRYGLIRDGMTQPLPAAADLIALASQHTLDGDGAAPTEQGLRTLGLDLSSAPPAPPPGQPLFFVDHGLIPDPINHVIPELIPH